MLRLDASELYGKSFEKLQSESQAVLLDRIGGPRGWHRGVVRSESTLLRKPYERARNIRASAQRGGAWTIRDGVETPFVLGITHEMPIEEYTPHFLFTTLDDALP